MAALKVVCPQCAKYCDVPVEDGDLTENSTTEGFEWQCQCGCAFSFDVHVEINNKETQQ